MRIVVDTNIAFSAILKTPASVKVEDKTANEKVQLILQLDEDNTTLFIVLLME